MELEWLGRAFQYLPLILRTALLSFGVIVLLAAQDTPFPITLVSQSPIAPHKAELHAQHATLDTTFLLEMEILDVFLLLLTVLYTAELVVLHAYRGTTLLDLQFLDWLVLRRHAKILSLITVKNKTQQDASSAIRDTLFLIPNV